MANREFDATIEASPLAGTIARMRRVHAREEIGRPYAVTVEIAINDTSFDTTELLGLDLSLRLSRGEAERRWVGLVHEVTEGSVRGQTTWANVVLAPALRLLALRTNTRMFQEKTVPEILETVLGETLSTYGRSARLELQDTYEAREYCLQYQESDLDFVHRLMEEEGIAYYFDHAGEVEEMILVDANAAYPPAPTASGDGQIPFHTHELAAAHHDGVHRLEPKLADTTTSVTVRDFDWTQGTLPVNEAVEAEDAMGRARESYEHGIGQQAQLGSYDDGVRRYQKNDAARQAQLRQETALLGGDTARGESRELRLGAGHKIVLAGHPHVGVDGEYLLTRVEHRMSAPGVDHDGDSYQNRFECLPFASRFRPQRRTQKPRIAGVQTAIVTGPSGEEIHTDAHGRIKALFHWDRENPSDETSSCWLRVKQEWAGAGWGFWWVPRIGMEVIVHFIDGDPDRPLVTGCVYDAANATPYALPDEKTKSTIKSNSSIGSGFNELRFEDKAGSEEIYSHAQKDYNEVVENDHTTTVHHDQKNDVDNDQTQTVGANQKERVDVDQSMTVHANRKVHVKGNFDEKVDGTETRHTKGDVSESFDANETRAISGNVDEAVSASETRTIGASQTETISGNQVLSVTGSSTLDVSGALTQSVTGGITTTTPATFVANATGGWKVDAAGGINIVAPAGVELKFPAGVTRVDSFWYLVAGKATEGSSLELSYFTIKFGICGFTTGAGAINIEFCSSSKSAWGVKMFQKGGKADKWGAYHTEGGAFDFSFDFDIRL